MHKLHNTVLPFYVCVGLSIRLSASLVLVCPSLSFSLCFHCVLDQPVPTRVSHRSLSLPETHIFLSASLVTPGQGQGHRKK
jgi:hypothetical protein